MYVLRLQLQSNLTLRTFLVTDILVLKVKLFLSWQFLKLIWPSWSLVIWFLKQSWFLSWRFLKSSLTVFKIILSHRTKLLRLIRICCDFKVIVLLRQCVTIIKRLVISKRQLEGFKLSANVFIHTRDLWNVFLIWCLRLNSE